MTRTRRFSCTVEWRQLHDRISHASRMSGSLLNADIDRKHRSTLLDAEPGSLKHLITRTPMSNWMIHPYWLQRLKWVGLLPFVHLVEATHTQEIEGRHPGFQTTRMAYDGSLLTCLVDRWRPETHTFHFRWVEMAPTLHDVSYLLGLPLAGVPIGPVDAPKNWAQEMGQRFYGICEGAPEFTYENHGPKFDWLQNYQLQRFGYPDVLMTAPQITRSLEAYLLWLLGKVMFTENHVSTISARYIRYAREITEATCQNDITQWSWGSAVLAATYRGMCTGCTLTKEKSALLGCPLLLQLWSWERFPIGRPEVAKNQAVIVQGERPVVYESDMLFDHERIDMPTFGIHWTRRKCRFAGEQVTRCYPAFSEQFDTLKEESVIWEPYTTAEAFARYPGGLSIMCRRDEDYWLTKSKIIFDCQVEEMSQQRVMRQFGLRQMVDPPSPEAPLSSDVHMYSRKGTKRSANQWL
uniref:Uncharacterized protein n=1 Tax=Avena sativa TaxID=4498 RepID=A0ACD5WWJ2_AVESA